MEWLGQEWDYAAWSDSTKEAAIFGTVDECVAQLRAQLAALRRLPLCGCFGWRCARRPAQRQTPAGAVERAPGCREADEGR
jgi:hypothetical protein